MLNLNSIRKNVYLPLVICLLSYVYVGYFIERWESEELFFAYFFAFISYLYILYQKPGAQQVQGLLAMAILFRLVFIVSFPALSDDIYRFVWDGRLLNAGIHPFAELPSYYLIEGHGVAGLDEELFFKLNSPNYYTIYPPLAQFIYWLATVFTDSIVGSAIIIRVLIIFAEIGTLFIGAKLLQKYSFPSRNILIYALNPLVVVELTGNLHFEAFLIFFLLLSIHCLRHNAISKSAFFMAASIASKLLPLMLLPLFIRRLKLKPLIIWMILIGVFTVIFFMPLFSIDLINGMSSSMCLYFQKFEFNASIYYLIREIGYSMTGYNIIESAGKILPILVLVFIVILSVVKLKQANIFETMMFGLTGYFLLSTTVHPWYITTILVCSIFSNYRYPIIWTGLIFLTYSGYTETGYMENMLWVSLEYFLVITILLYEIITITKNKDSRIATYF